MEKKTRVFLTPVEFGTSMHPKNDFCSWNLSLQRTFWAEQFLEMFARMRRLCSNGSKQHLFYQLSLVSDDICSTSCHWFQMAFVLPVVIGFCLHLFYQLSLVSDDICSTSSHWFLMTFVLPNHTWCEVRLECQSYLVILNVICSKVR
jgi:hypothetical protein